MLRKYTTTIGRAYDDDPERESIDNNSRSACENIECRTVSRQTSDEFICDWSSCCFTMNQDFLDMESVTLELTSEELERVDDIAFANHRENRDAALRELLDQWLKGRDE